MGVRQIFALADAIDPRYRALVLLAAFASLQWGELAARRRSDLAWIWLAGSRRTTR